MPTEPYSLIVPYYKTPEITRLALKSIEFFSTLPHEVIVVDNAPGLPESAMLSEFKNIQVIDNPTSLTGSAANFEALDIGITHASHDLLGLLHSDTIFLKRGWDEIIFQRYCRRNLAVLGTFEREASPQRPWKRKIRDWWVHAHHQAVPEKGAKGKLMLFSLFTRRSFLQRAGFTFCGQGHLTPDHVLDLQAGIEVMSCHEISRLMWHTSNVTSVLTGQMEDSRMRKSFELKRARLLGHPSIRQLLETMR